MRPKFLLIAVLFLVTLLAAKIIISGLYLHFDGLKNPTMKIVTKGNVIRRAIAEEVDVKQAETTSSSIIDPVATMARLKKKEQELEEREAAVLKKEQELAPLQAEVEAKIEELNELQVTLTAMAKDIAERELELQDEKINHLVSLYSSMDASEAAKIMDKLNLDTVVRILANMRGKSAGAILAAMSTDKGAVISERLSSSE